MKLSCLAAWRLEKEILVLEFKNFIHLNMAIVVEAIIYHQQISIRLLLKFFFSKRSVLFFTTNPCLYLADKLLLFFHFTDEIG